MGNMKQLCTVAFAYADAHDGNLPPPESWLEIFPNYDIDDGILADPSEPDAGRAYAMNARLSGLHFGAVRNTGRTVLFFECRFGAPPGGGPKLLPDEPRYFDSYIVGFCDEHVEHVPKDQIHRLVWDPMGE